MRNHFSGSSSDFHFVLKVTLLVAFVGALLLLLPPEKDSTDPVDGRSGMVLYVDAATGCNYLSTGYRHGLTPRLRRDGSHWCDDLPQRVR